MNFAARGHLRLKLTAGMWPASQDCDRPGDQPGGAAGAARECPGSTCLPSSPVGTIQLVCSSGTETLTRDSWRSVHRGTRMKKIARLSEVWRSSGPRGAFRFLARSLVFKKWHTIVYRDELGLKRPESEFPESFTFTIHSPSARTPKSMRASIAKAGGREFLLSLSNEDSLWTISYQNRCVAWGAVSPQSKQARILRLPADAVLLGSGFVVPAFRNRGLHRKALNAVALWTARTLGRRAWLEVAPDNTASIRGIEAAGFSKVREVKMRVLLRSIIIEDRCVRWVR